MTYHYRCHSIVKLNFVKLIQVARKSSLIYQLYFELTFVLEFKKNLDGTYTTISSYYNISLCKNNGLPQTLRKSRLGKAHHVVHTK